MLYPCPVLMGLDLIVTLMLSSHYNESVVQQKCAKLWLVHNLVFSNCARYVRNLQILWHFSNKVVFVEVVCSVITSSPG